MIFVSAAADNTGSDSLLSMPFSLRQPSTTPYPDTIDIDLPEDFLKNDDLQCKYPSVKKPSNHHVEHIVGVLPSWNPNVVLVRPQDVHNINCD